MECPDARLSLGVYVLGVIDQAERALVDAHLETCQECRDELAALQGLPALLALVSKEEAIGLADTGGGADAPSPLGEDEPPRELLASVLDLTAARRRRRRWRDASLAAAAAAIVAVGVFGGLQLGSSPAQLQAQNLYYGPQNGQMTTSTGRSGNMTATVAYVSMGWGTALGAKVTGIPIGTNCYLWAIEKNGNRVRVGNWITDNLEGHVWYPASTSVSTDDIASFEVTVGQAQTIQVQA